MSDQPTQPAQGEGEFEDAEARQALEKRFATMHASLQRGASQRAAEAVIAVADRRPLPAKVLPQEPDSQ